jgi:hypothetical protein
MTTYYIGGRYRHRKKHRDPECRALQDTIVRERTPKQVVNHDECGHCCGSGTQYATTHKVSLRARLAGGADD